MKTELLELLDESNRIFIQTVWPDFYIEVEKQKAKDFILSLNNAEKHVMFELTGGTLWLSERPEEW